MATFENSTKEDLIKIEVVNKESLDFDFSIKYLERRDQIHIRSEKALKSLRIANDFQKAKAYDVRGSNLVMIPRLDFKTGEYYAEIKFQKVNTTVIAKIEVPEFLESKVD